MKRLGFVSVLLVIGLLVIPAVAQNGAPNGSHYNLNIIGMDNAKNGTLTDSNRHTIFVALGSSKQGVPGIETKIYLTQGDFQVCDGNGFDAATDCNGDPVGSNTGGTGAVFQLPCNSYATADYDCVGYAQDYTVWIRVLGKPGGDITMTTCTYDKEYNMTYCNSEQHVGIVSLKRTAGKQTFKNVTNELTTVYASLDGGLTYHVYPLFYPGFEEWWWSYVNKGVRLAQLRFYPVQ